LKSHLEKGATLHLDGSAVVSIPIRATSVSDWRRRRDGAWVH
jgi:hypothetical protein